MVYSLRVEWLADGETYVDQCSNAQSNTIPVRAYWHQWTLDTNFKYIVYSLNTMQYKYNVFDHTAPPLRQFNGNGDVADQSTA